MRWNLSANTIWFEVNSRPKPELVSVGLRHQTRDRSLALIRDCLPYSCIIKFSRKLDSSDALRRPVLKPPDWLLGNQSPRPRAEAESCAILPIIDAQVSCAYTMRMLYGPVNGASNAHRTPR